MRAVSEGEEAPFPYTSQRKRREGIAFAPPVTGRLRRVNASDARPPPGYHRRRDDICVRLERLVYRYVDVIIKRAVCQRTNIVWNP